MGFELNGKCIQQIGTPGSKEGQFNHTCGTAIHNTDEDIYVSIKQQITNILKYLHIAFEVVQTLRYALKG